MGNVVLDMSISLDGFIAGPSDEAAGLHDYFFAPTAATLEVIQEGLQTTGAIIIGRRTYTIGTEQDGFVNNPYQVPHFILSHDVPNKVAKGAESFTFVTDGIISALHRATVAAGTKNVVIGGGANTAQQYLAAGLIDEIQIHLVPVLLGAGIRLFDHLRAKHMALEKQRVISTSAVTHLKYRVINQGKT